MSIANEQKQLPLWDLNLRYVHLLKQMFDSGDCATMGGSCFLLWCCLKTYSDWNTGVAYPSIATLSEKLEQSPKSTGLQLKKLEAMGYIEKHKTQGKNYYRVIDKFKVEELTTGETETEIERPYVPEQFAKGMANLKKMRNNEITPQQLEGLGFKVSMPQVIVNNFYVSGSGNQITTNQVIIQKQESEQANTEEVLRKLIEQRDTATNVIERNTAERWIEVMKKELQDEQTTPIEATVEETEKS